jgi:hypothetical protein
MKQEFDGYKQGRDADLWWRKLNHELRMKYAKEKLDKKGLILKFKNDGFIAGLTLTEVVDLFRRYAYSQINETINN